jgi:glucokinase
VDKQGQLGASFKFKTEKDKTIEEILDEIVVYCQNLIETIDPEKNPVKAIGIGVPGVINQEEGKLEFAPNLPGWSGYSIRDHISKALDLPVYLENDVNLGTLGESVLGAGKGFKTCFGIFVGTGIGGGLCIEDEIVNGAGNGAGEIGHIVIQHNSKVKCGCEKYGHFEAYASRTALADYIVSKSKKNPRSVYKKWTKNYSKPIRSQMIKKALTHNDKITKKALKREAYFLGVGISTVINLINPEAIILGGGLMEAIGPFILPNVFKQTKKRAVDRNFDSTRILLAGYGDFSVIAGGAVLAIKKLGL